MQKVFIDTDVVIDFLIDRKPYSEHAAVILTLSEYGHIKACASALTFANCYYILKKFSSHSKVISKLSQLIDMIDIIDLTRKTILESLKSNFKDFEDSIQNETAKSDDLIKVLITRSTKDYKESNLCIMTPETFLNSLSK